MGEDMATKKNTSINGNEYFRIRRTIDGRIKNFYGSSKGDAERKYKEYLEELAERKYQKEVEESTDLVKAPSGKIRLVIEEL